MRVDLTIGSETMPAMHFGFHSKVKVVVALAVALQLVVITVAPALSYDGLLVKSKDSSVGKPSVQCFSRSRYCVNVQSSFGPGRIAGASGFPLSSSWLRFDLKQNLSVWPVLSNGRERSPPFLFAR
jgi:hypothetical protein